MEGDGHLGGGVVGHGPFSRVGEGFFLALPGQLGLVFVPVYTLGLT